MKDYYEKIYEIVEKRGEERLRRKQVSISRRHSIIYSAAGLCAAIIVGFGIWHNNNIKQLTNRESNEPEIITTISETTSSAPKTTTSQTGTSYTTSSTPPKTTTASISNTQITSSAQTTAEAVNSLQTTIIESTYNNEQLSETVTSAKISDIRLIAPDIDTVKSKFSEIHLDNGITYKLLYADIDRSTIGMLQKEVNLTNINTAENKRYISDAEIYDVALESTEDLIAVKYSGSEESFLYSPDDTASLDWVDFAISYNEYENSYRSCRTNRISDEKIGEFLGDINLKGINEFNFEEISVSGKIYKIANIAVDCAFAVKYDTDGEYHLFRNINYTPETLGKMISDMNLKDELKIVSARIDEQTYAIDNEKVWEYILSENNAQSYVKGITPSNYGITVDIPTLGRVRIAITVYADGHISTNIPNRSVSFNIGIENTEKFIDYVKQYGVPIELHEHPLNVNVAEE